MTKGMMHVVIKSEEVSIRPACEDTYFGQKGRGKYSIKMSG